MGEEQSDQQVYDALEKALYLYEPYLELSRVAEVVPDDLGQPSEPRPPLPQPLELIIHDVPTLFGS